MRSASYATCIQHERQRRQNAESFDFWCRITHRCSRTSLQTERTEMENIDFWF